jgi:beta-glucosidase
MSDGPNGVRGESIHSPKKAACFPSGACMGATFNAELLHKVGRAIGFEAKTKNVGVLLGPTINIHRHPYSLYPSILIITYYQLKVIENRWPQF